MIRVKRSTGFLLLIMAMLFTSVMGSTEFFSISTGAFQLSPYRLLAFVWVAITFIWAVKDVCARRIPLAENWLIYAFYILWTGYALISFIWVKDRSAWLKACFFLGFGTTGILAIGYMAREKGGLYAMLCAVMAGIMLASLMGWHEALTGDYLFHQEINASALTDGTVWNQSKRTWHFRMPIVWFKNINGMAYVMACGHFIAYTLLGLSRPISRQEGDSVGTSLMARVALWIKRAAPRLLFAACMISCSLICLQSASRSCLLALVIGDAFLLVIHLCRGCRKPKKLIPVAVYILVVTIALPLPQLGKTKGDWQEARNLSTQNVASIVDFQFDKVIETVKRFVVGAPGKTDQKIDAVAATAPPFTTPSITPAPTVNATVNAQTMPQPTLLPEETVAPIAYVDVSPTPDVADMDQKDASVLAEKMAQIISDQTVIKAKAEFTLKEIAQASLSDQEGTGDMSANIRLYQIINSFQLLKKSRLIGVGAGNFEYYIAAKTPGLRDTSGILNAHNWFCEVLANYGVLIGVPYIIIMLMMWFCFFKNAVRAKDDKEKNLATGMFVILTFFFVASIAHSSLQSLECQWLINGLLIAGYGILKKKKVKTSIRH